MIGAHGEVAIACTEGRGVLMIGSKEIRSGIGVTSGLAVGLALIDISNFGLALAATLPLFSSAPRSIHFAINWISGLGIFVQLGGISGVSSCVIN